MNRANIIKNNRSSEKKLRKKRGDDKLVVSLVLIAVGVILCFVYRDKITYAIGQAVTSLNAKITSVFNDAKTGSGDNSGGSGGSGGSEEITG